MVSCAFVDSIDVRFDLMIDDTYAYTYICVPCFITFEQWT